MQDFRFEQSSGYRSRFRSYIKKYSREMEAIRKNLFRTIEIHEELSLPLTQIRFGPLRYESDGIFRLSQQGGGKGLAQVRLYFAIDEAEKILYLLYLGTKTQQFQDIKQAKKELKQLKKQRITIHG